MEVPTSLVSSNAQSQISDPDTYLDSNPFLLSSSITYGMFTVCLITYGMSIEIWLMLVSMSSSIRNVSGSVKEIPGFLKWKGALTPNTSPVRVT